MKLFATNAVGNPSGQMICDRLEMQFEDHVDPDVRAAAPEVRIAAE